ncbi:cystatin-S-like isoform X1 [Aotus nancymaae]|uniref:cystatin-S-like isoform X1 n=2 Tax=Aotus nancymaae TaxID=37293 RepID=UPI0030FE2479
MEGVGLGCPSRINAWLLLLWVSRLRLSASSPAASALCSASEEPMALPLCIPLLLLAALPVALAAEEDRILPSPEEEDTILLSSQKENQNFVSGIYDADLNDEWVQRALHFAVSKYNEATKDAYYRRPLRVLRAREQTVAGTNYFFDVEIGRTTCTKSLPDLDTCPFREQPELQKKEFCSFQIYEVPWENTMSLVKSRCQKA